MIKFSKQPRIIHMLIVGEECLIDLDNKIVEDLKDQFREYYKKARKKCFAV